VTLGGEEVRASARAAQGLFARLADGTVPVPALHTDAAGAVAHVTSCLTWYAHEWGLADPSGFAAMGCAELLLHTGDVAAAGGLSWTPPGTLADAVLARLFPWAPTDAEPWAALLWATGRGPLPGREPVTSWRWHCAPLEEWDGTQLR
jgi:hypothetical protein